MITDECNYLKGRQNCSRSTPRRTKTVGWRSLVWSKIPPEVYTISFSANGGSGAPSAVSKTESVTMYLPTTVPTRQNYDFLGWSLSSTATTATYSAGGSFTRNANTTLYAVWSYNPETYTVSYNANGGSGAPSSQTKTYGVSLTLSSVVPTRGGYNFLGWSTSSTATSATYSTGGSYTANAGATLYAVWEKANYEFSISNLTVSDSEPYRYGTITVKVRTDSWDQKNPYSDIPVQLYYDGRLMSTQYVDFAAYGDRGSSLQQELSEAMDVIFKKNVPAQVREYINRNNPPITKPVKSE